MIYLLLDLLFKDQQVHLTQFSIPVIILYGLSNIVSRYCVVLFASGFARLSVKCVVKLEQQSQSCSFN